RVRANWQVVFVRKDIPYPMSKPEPKRPANLPEPANKRPDKGNSSNFFWFLMILAVVGTIVFSFSSKWRAEQLTYSEFAKQLENNELGPNNVYDLRRGHTTITYQDQPRNTAISKSGPNPKQFTVSIGSMSDAEKKRL